MPPQHVAGSLTTINNQTQSMGNVRHRQHLPLRYFQAGRSYNNNVTKVGVVNVGHLRRRLNVGNTTDNRRPRWLRSPVTHTTEEGWHAAGVNVGGQACCR